MCLKNNFSTPIKALEIGTWFGKGSTQIWFRHIPSQSSLFLIDSWRPYLSKADLNGDNTSYKSMQDLTYAALCSTLKEVCAFEQQRQDVSITTIRGKSYEVLERFTENIFDFIYIDGSHYYADVKKDIACAKRLARKEFSIICGDDYELPHNDARLTTARNNLDRDFVSDEFGSFHPGVFLAIYEEFGRVNVKNGFWWIICRNGSFSIDNLKPTPQLV